jgi:uncharacterized protein (DUF3820 family)
MSDTKPDTPYHRFVEFVNDEPDAMRLIDNYRRFMESEAELQSKKADLMPIGKYKNKKIKDVAIIDKPYIQWLLRQQFIERYPMQKEVMMKYR